MDDRTDAPSPEAPHRRRVRLILLSVVALVLLAGLAAGFHRWTHPSLFEDGGSGGFKADPQALSKFPFYVGFGYPKDGSDPETITINDARVHFSPNTAGATGTIAICTRREVEEGTLSLGFATADDPPEKYCTRLRTIKPGTRMTYGKQTQYLVLTIKPTRSGTAKVQAIDIDYTRGWRHLHQHGSQHLTQDVTIQVG